MHMACANMDIVIDVHDMNMNMNVNMTARARDLAQHVSAAGQEARVHEQQEDRGLVAIVAFLL